MSHFIPCPSPSFQPKAPFQCYLQPPICSIPVPNYLIIYSSNLPQHYLPNYCFLPFFYLRTTYIHLYHLCFVLLAYSLYYKLHVILSFTHMILPTKCKLSPYYLHIYIYIYVYSMFAPSVAIYYTYALLIA